MTSLSPSFAVAPPHGLPDLIEHDACALAAFVTRDGKPDRRMVEHALEALQMMVHRSGSVDGEGDGNSSDGACDIACAAPGASGKAGGGDTTLAAAAP